MKYVGICFIAAMAVAVLFTACGRGSPALPDPMSEMKVENVGSVSVNTTDRWAAIYVFRYAVEGGWVYVTYRGDTRGGISQVFVPAPAR